MQRRYNQVKLKIRSHVIDTLYLQLVLLFGSFMMLAIILIYY